MVFFNSKLNCLSWTGCDTTVTQTWTNVFVNAGQQPTSRYGHAAVVYSKHCWPLDCGSCWCTRVMFIVSDVLDNAMYIFGGSDRHYDRESLSSRNSSEHGRLDAGRYVNDMHSFNLGTC